MSRDSMRRMERRAFLPERIKTKEGTDQRQTEQREGMTDASKSPLNIFSTSMPTRSRLILSLNAFLMSSSLSASTISGWSSKP